MAGGNPHQVGYGTIVQLIGGIVLHQGKIAEMATGEGKTLVATLPVFLNALTGNGVHVVTVNDYLSKRDASGWDPSICSTALASIVSSKYQPNSPERLKAYNCDITLVQIMSLASTTANMARTPADLVQRKHNYAIVDEVDSHLLTMPVPLSSSQVQ